MNDDLNNQKQPVYEAVKDIPKTFEIDQSLFSKSFLWMFWGILCTAIVSFITYSTGLLATMVGKTGIIVALIVELVVVLAFSFGFKKLSATVVSVLYFLYAIVNGFVLSILFYAYELNSIVLLFGVTALIFGGLSVIGKTTKADIMPYGKMIGLFLLGGIILTIVNLFLKNPMLDIALDWAMLALFCGCTIYDVYRLKNQSLDYGEDMTQGGKLHVYFAMQLYLDFVNIFLRILSIMGKRKN